MKKWLSLILAFLMLLALLCGCGGEGANTNDGKEAVSDKKGETAADGKEAADEGKRTYCKVALTNEVTSMSPTSNINPYTISVKECVFEHLAERDNTGKIICVLLKGYEQVEPGVYACELYDYITDSAGNKITSSDVEYCFNTARDEGLDNMKLYDHVNIKDEYNFELVITPGLGNFELLCETVFIYAQAAREASPDQFATQGVVGTGPYLNTAFTSNVLMRMEKRDDYWQTPELTASCSQANVDVIDYTVLNEVTQMGLAVEDKTVDFAWYLNDSLVADAQDVDGYVCTAVANPQLRGFVFNCSEHSIFGGENGKLLRQAVCYAINSQAIIDAALYGNGSIPETWGNGTAMGYNTEWEEGDYYPYDPVKAKELLAEAGYPDGFTFTFYNSVNNPNPAVAQVVQANLADVGIIVDYQAFDGTTNGTYKADYTIGWDMENGDCSIRGPYLISTLASYVDNRLYSHGRSVGGIQDDYLQSLVEACYEEDYTQEDLDALHEYVVENAFCYQGYAMNYVAAHNEKISDLYYNFRCGVQVGCCTFADDYDVYFEE